MTSPEPRSGAPVQGGTIPPPDRRPSRRRRLIVAVSATAIIAGLVAAVLALTPPPGDPSSQQSPSAPTEGLGAPSPTPSASPSESMDDPGEIDPPVVPEEGAVMLDEVGQIAPGLTARIAIAEMVAGVAQGPGEVAAEAVRLTIVVTNSAPEEASLRTAVVSTYFGSDRVPALELREPGGRPLPPAVDAMAETEGVYLFVVPEEDLDDVTIMVDYSVDAEPLVFRGSVAELMAS